MVKEKMLPLLSLVLMLWRWPVPQKAVVAVAVVVFVVVGIVDSMKFGGQHLFDQDIQNMWTVHDELFSDSLRHQ
jgi:hypothetical protein